MSASLSACIVLYHCGDEVVEALQCLENSNVEVTVYLCDNSPEEPMADNLQWAFPGVSVLPQERNVGFSRANNAVLPSLRSKYHLIMNPDVTFEPTLLYRMMQYMDAHPNIAILTPRVFNEDGTEQFLPKKRVSVHYLLGGFLENHGRLFRRWREDYTLANMQIQHPVPVEFATGCFLMIRTNVFQELQGFDRRVLEQKLGSIVYHPDMCITHHWARDNTRTVRGSLRQIRSVIKYFAKWGITW